MKKNTSDSAEVKCNMIKNASESMRAIPTPSKVPPEKI
jgi:hypothetical protein